MAPRPVTLDDVRHYLLDRDAQDNFLLDDLEFDDETIIKGMEFTVDKFNTTHPLVISHTLESFPYRAEMIQGASAYCLRAMAMNKLRNRVEARTEGGTQIGDKNKFAEYMSIAREISDDLEVQFRQIKVSINAESAYRIVR